MPHAALQALDVGYRVIMVVDACGGMSQAREAAAVEHMRQAGTVPSSVSIGPMLSPDFTQLEGRQMFDIVQKLRLV